MRRVHASVECHTEADMIEKKEETRRVKGDISISKGVGGCRKDSKGWQGVREM